MQPKGASRGCTRLGGHTALGRCTRSTLAPCGPRLSGGWRTSFATSHIAAKPPTTVTEMTTDTTTLRLSRAGSALGHGTLHGGGGGHGGRGRARGSSRAPMAMTYVKQAMATGVMIEKSCSSSALNWT